MVGDIAHRWEELQGINYWKGLLEPKLDDDLRTSILIYGGLTAAVGDSYEGNEGAKYPRECRYNKDHFFEMVGLEKGNSYKYLVTKYIYTTSVGPLSGIITSHFGAYVAVATDEAAELLGRRDVVVAWGGSQDEDWRSNIDFPLVDAAEKLGEGVVGKVHEGFLTEYTFANKDSPFEYTNSARDQVLEEVKNLVDEYKNKGEEVSITLTGYSLGAALATLNSIDIANYYNRLSGNPAGKPRLVTGVVFGSPRVGDPDFCNNYNTTENLRLLKVRNWLDLLVPNLPPPPLYSDCGVELVIDTNQSPYLKPDLHEVHYLEVYLHGVAGTEGSNGRFNDPTKFRQLALVNKGSDFLKDEYKVPAFWWKETKGMEQADDGSWNKPPCNYV